MYNQYLDTLGLQPGASKLDIKKAYRELSKKYHPDVSKDPEAKEKFIRLTQAYEFLNKVGPSPNHEPISYDYDPFEEYYRNRRAEAYQRAKKRAWDAEMRQKTLIKRILRVYELIAAVILVFNVLLILDYYLPKAKVPQSYDSEKSKLSNKDSRTTTYFRAVFQDYSVNLSPKATYDIVHGARHEVEVTMIWGKPFGVYSMVDDRMKYNAGYFDVFHIYGFLIVLIAVLFLMYHFLFVYLDQKLGAAIAIVFLFIAQVYLFFYT